ncbi:MAG: hypothetical protein AB7E51_00600 [Pseudodesulfovibrio sp.]|uniref:hypothetical protein n=1 Tax=Pseudodesulfovibrio sp. TaxID=2035812 RepID=UPI003D1315FB
MTRRDLLLLMLLPAFTACAPDRDTLPGDYSARNGEIEIRLRLGKDGKGVWSTDTDEIPFKWSRRDEGHIWLHTVAGGVIPGTIEGEDIRLTLPGVPPLVFTPLP